MSTAATILATVIVSVAGIWGVLLLIALIIFYLRRGETAPSAGDPGIRTLDDAVKICRASGLTGWALVEHAQRLVARHMSVYGFWNSFDPPRRAFERRMGYCWQRAGALESILKELGFQVEKVHTFLNHFPASTKNGRSTGGHLSGHVWLWVRYDSVGKDVCPGDENNLPGRVHFDSKTPVFRWGPGIFLLTYLGVPVANLILGLASSLQNRRSEL